MEAIKKEYIANINELMSQCEDISLLDLIHKILLKEQAQ